MIYLCEITDVVLDTIWMKNHFLFINSWKLVTQGYHKVSCIMCSFKNEKTTKRLRKIAAISGNTVR